MAGQSGRWAVGALFAANGCLMGVWAPQIPLLLPRHDITESVLGLLILGLGVGAVGAMLFSGKLIAAHGSRRMALIFGALIVPMLPLIVLAPNLWTLAPAMMAMGAFAGCMDVSMNANAVEVERQMGRAIMSSSHGFWSLGGFVGGSIGAYVLARLGPEVQSLLAALVIAGLVLAARPFLVEDRREPVTRSEGAAAPASALIPRDLALWMLGAMALISMVPEGGVLDWAALYLGKTHGADEFTAGLGFALFAGAMAMMRFLGDRVRNRFGAVRTLRASGLVAALGMGLGAVAPGPELAIAGFVFCGLGIANMVPIIFSAAGNHPGLPSGQAISTVTMVGYAGILIAPATIGFVAEHLGYRLTFGGLAVILLVVAAGAGRTRAADDLQAHK